MRPRSWVLLRAEKSTGRKYITPIRRVSGKRWLCVDYLRHHLFSRASALLQAIAGASPRGRDGAGFRYCARRCRRRRERPPRRGRCSPRATGAGSDTANGWCSCRCRRRRCRRTRIADGGWRSGRRRRVPGSDCGVGLGEEEMEVEKVAHDLRMDQQRGVEQLGSVAASICNSCSSSASSSSAVCAPRNGIANLLLDVHRLGERAQVEADDRAFQPDLRGGDHPGRCRGISRRDQYFRQGGHRLPPRGR